MDSMGGIFGRIALAMAGKRSPWGGGSGSGGNDDGDKDSGQSQGDKPAGEDKSRGPRNPWLPGGGSGGNEDGEPRRSASIEDIFRTRGPEGPRRTNGGGPRGPGGPNFRIPTRPDGSSYLPLLFGIVALIWLGVTSAHQIGPKEEGIVTTFGKYSRTITPGLKFTAPWPFQSVSVTDVRSIHQESIPDSNDEKLMLTGDQNLVDLSYIVRWNIKNLKAYTFQLAEPDDTLREVAEAAMRASVAEEPLDRVLSGAGRADIELRVRTRMQSILDAYHAGILVQGVDIKKTDPPTRVVEAFKKVSAAQQEAESALNKARGTAERLLAKAQADAASFDKVYEEYKLAPEVTRRRMYYETMERVLHNNDKTVIQAPGTTTYLPLPAMRENQRQPKEGE